MQSDRANSVPSQQLQDLAELKEPPVSVHTAPKVEVSCGITKNSDIFEQVAACSAQKFFLDIFAGATMPVSMALIPFASDRVQPVDLIHGHDLLDDDIFESVLLLAASGLIGAALAAPYCSKHSRATLRPDGPAPVRTPEYIDGLLSNSPLQQLAVEESAAHR